MKVKTISCIIAIVILGVLLPAFSNPEIITKKQGNVTYHTNSKDPIKLAQDFYELSPEEKLKLLKSSDTLLPIYYIAVADYYYANDMKEHGLISYMLGSLRGMQDTAMCVDYTARGQIQMYPMLAPKTAEYMINLDSKKLMKIAKVVVKWDEEHSTRPNPKWACYHGIKSFLGEVEIKPMSEYPAIQKEFRNDFLQTIKDIEKIKKQVNK